MAEHACCIDLKSRDTVLLSHLSGGGLSGGGGLCTGGGLRAGRVVSMQTSQGIRFQGGCSCTCPGCQDKAMLCLTCLGEGSQAAVGSGLAADCMQAEVSACWIGGGLHVRNKSACRPSFAPAGMPCCRFQPCSTMKRAQVHEGGGEEPLQDRHSRSPYPSGRGLSRGGGESGGLHSRQAQVGVCTMASVDAHARGWPVLGWQGGGLGGEGSIQHQSCGCRHRPVRSHACWVDVEMI